MTNEQVAEIFVAMADMLAIRGENYHRVMAYRRAAENVAALGRPLEEVWRAGELEEIPSQPARPAGRARAAGGGTGRSAGHQLRRSSPGRVRCAAFWRGDGPARLGHSDRRVEHPARRGGVGLGRPARVGGRRI